MIQRKTKRRNGIGSGTGVGSDWLSVREDFMEEVKVGVMSVLEGRAFPAKKAASAKAPRQKHVWPVQ